MSGIEIRTASGEALLPYLPSLAELRIEVFAEWPYLYEGDVGYEERYLRHYAESPGAAVVLALAGDRVVGAATCQPMSEAAPAVREAIAAAGLDPARFCYFGESVLRRPFRGRGIGVRFFAEREAHARALGLTHAAFCAVQRQADDPRRPPDYRPLDAFWMRRGYTPRPDITCRFDWAEPGSGGREIPHTLSFWVRAL
ncbi:MAG: GNAT family N-acetyltransferase [Rhodovarius sp.]|nr:GNAT family N-acetyltransferase [Rhodovarius sp.]MCX7932400.1 GNAT family N-acetyltransferase [Rhodovarius sp.]MDW8315121.1 GNAT family N-acetyltransferase [Rhodovarius sp.]